jgi:hypothetical protein
MQMKGTTAKPASKPVLQVQSADPAPAPLREHKLAA